jgi:hypothetical protein
MQLNVPSFKLLRTKVTCQPLVLLWPGPFRPSAGSRIDFTRPINLLTETEPGLVSALSVSSKSSVLDSAGEKILLWFEPQLDKWSEASAKEILKSHHA